MISNSDIQQGAVTQTKLSKNLRLPLNNIKAGAEGQVLVGQANGDLEYKDVSGAIGINADGVATMTATTDLIPEGDTNLYYTDARVDARIKAIRTQTDQLATHEEPGFMPPADKQKVDSDALMSSSDKDKLDGIEPSATADQTASEIKTAYESNSDTNAFTDADQSKLASLPASAEENVNADWNATTGDAQILHKPTLGTAAAAATTDFAAANHDHDDRYYTETETDTLLAAKASSTHNHDSTYLGIAAQAADADTLDGQHGSEFAAADHGHTASDVTDGSFDDARISASSVTQHQASIDHDALTNFVANEHIDWTADQGATNIHTGNYNNTEYTAGTGLSLSGTEFSYDNSVIASQTDLSNTSALHLSISNNLSDLNNAGTARSNLGLGSAAQSATTDFASSGHTHSAATTSANGFMSSTDKTKLDAYPSTNATHNNEFLRKDGTFTSTPAGSGSGTVNSGTANEMAFYAADGTAVSGTGAFTLENTTTQEFNIGDAANKGELGISCNSNLTSSTYPLYVGGSTRSSSYFGTTETTPTHFVTPDAGDGAACFYGHGYVALKAITSEPQLGNNYAGLYAILDQYSSTEANLWAVGTDGTETQISPHDADGNWVFNSIDRKRGKRTKINMIEVIRALEETTGRQFIFEEEL